MRHGVAGLLWVGVLICQVGAVVGVPNHPANSNIVMLDTLWVDSSETEYSRGWWVCEGGHHSLWVELQDTGVAGLASDSCVVRIEVYQGMSLQADWLNQLFVVVPSRAHPDSAELGGSRFVIADSLDIRALDTTTIWTRTRTGRTTAAGDTMRYYTERLSARYTRTGVASIGAFTYYAFAPDYSGAVFFRVTGLTGNRKRSVGSRVILRVIQESGTPVKVMGQ